MTLKPDRSRTTWTRRAFTGHLAAATAAAFLPVLSPPRRAGRYFDIHVHLGQPWSERPPLSVGDLLRWMDRNEIEQAAVLPVMNPEARDVPITTHYVLEQTLPHRDRLVPFCALDPRTTHLEGIRPKADLLRRYQDAGARGFGEHKPGIPVDDPRNLELFAACAEVGLPMLIHMDNVRNTDRPGLPGLEAALRQVPDGRFIAHAQAWWASISGDATQDALQGYPKGQVVPGGAVDRLLTTYPNLYGDLSAGSGANALLRDPEHGRSFLIRHADRLLFGTDYLMPGQDIPQLEVFAHLDLPPAVQVRIFRNNARRLLQLT